MKDMEKIIAFPNLKTGTKVALYTENRMYCGTISSKQSLPGGTGIFLNSVTVSPIAGQVLESDILHLDSLCVLWDHVVAIGFPPEFEK